MKKTMPTNMKPARLGHLLGDRLRFLAWPYAQHGQQAVTISF